MLCGSFFSQFWPEAFSGFYLYSVSSLQCLGMAFPGNTQLTSIQYFFCGSFVFFVSCVSHAFASVHCCLVVTNWERADLLALVGDV